MSLFRGQWGPLPILASGIDADVVKHVLRQQPADPANLFETDVDADLKRSAEDLSMAELLPVSIGTLADRILTEGTREFQGDTAFVSIAGITALFRRRHSPFVLHPEWAAEPMLEPLMAFGSVGISRGMSLAGQISPLKWHGYADVVGAYARNAASAALAAFAIAQTCHPSQVDEKQAHLPHLDPEETWEGLAPPARLASDLRQKGSIHAAAVSLRGRGRVVGTLDVDPLHRFRASVWR